MGVRRSILSSAVRERLLHDLGVLRGPAAAGLYASASALRLVGRRSAAFSLLMKLHASGLSATLDRRIVRLLREATAREQLGIGTGLWELYEEVIRSATNPHQSLLGSRVLVVKRARAGEKGVLTVHYSYTFPLLPKLFNLSEICKRYFLVLEPSWNGYCVPDILLYSRLNTPVFVETVEPRDREFLKQASDNLCPVFPVSSNCWVDHRLFAEKPTGERDIDVVMISAWARFKRHWRVFRALRQLKDRGHVLRMAAIGYPLDLTKEEVFAQARLFGIEDQIELFDRISPEKVSSLLARAKVHVLWSRREGSNKAIVEAMLADVPSIVREGFNYGHRYWHINSATGVFAREDALADTILDVISRVTDFSPRKWVLENMSCQWATRVLEEAVRRKAEEMGEPWTEGLAVKVNLLNTQEYWEPSDRDSFADDYAFLQRQLRVVAG